MPAGRKAGLGLSHGVLSWISLALRIENCKPLLSKTISKSVFEFAKLLILLKSTSSCGSWLPARH